MKFLLALLLVGCAGSFEGTRVRIVSPYCQSLDAVHRTWGGVAKGSGIAASGLGAAVIPNESSGARIGIAVGAIASGALAATSVFISEDAVGSYVRDCAN